MVLEKYHIMGIQVGLYGIGHFLGGRAARTWQWAISKDSVDSGIISSLTKGTSILATGGGIHGWA